MGVLVTITVTFIRILSTRDQEILDQETHFIEMCSVRVKVARYPVLYLGPDTITPSIYKAKFHPHVQPELFGQALAPARPLFLT